MTVKNEKIIVMDLNETNIDEFSKSMHLKGPIFIAFLADWCGHCQTVKPIWKEALESIKNINGRGHVVTVSDKHMGKLPCQQPSGFPSFKLFNAKNFVKDYDGGRNMEDFIKFMSEHMKHPSQKIKHGRKHSIKHYRKHSIKHDRKRKQSGGRKRKKTRKKTHRKRHKKTRKKTRKKRRKKTQGRSKFYIKKI